MQTSSSSLADLGKKKFSPSKTRSSLKSSNTQNASTSCHDRKKLIDPLQFVHGMTRQPVEDSIVQHKVPFYPWMFAMALAIIISSLATSTNLAAEPTIQTNPATSGNTKLDPTKPIETITFGSCNRHNKPQPLWQKIAALQPDLWIWLGDAVYADGPLGFSIEPYLKQREHPSYKWFLEKPITILGTWDDHDYGQNDGNRTWARKAEVQQIYLDFLDEPKKSPRRQQEGVYASYVLGTGPQKVKIYLLDVRYHQDPRGAGADLLGATQWRWLDQEIQRDRDARVHIFATGIQFLPEDHRFEKWSNFPRSREYLMALFDQHELDGIVVLSGDRHIAEISQAQTKAGRQVTDITSSGMTHYYDKFRQEPNRHRLGDVFAGYNFGSLRIDWQTPQPTLTARIHNSEGQTVLSHQFATSKPPSNPAAPEKN